MMAGIRKSLTELIGNTPLLELQHYNKKHELKGRVLAKLEYLNPGGSTKDRAALSMIVDAELNGSLKPGAVLIEPTSGNTGIGLACVAASRGYRVILTMPDTMSRERRSLLKAYGAELVLTDGAKGMQGAVEMAEQLAEKIPGSLIPGQFENKANPAAHYKTTGPEIWRDTNGMAEAFVAGVGTGGTITGAGRYLKEMNPNIHIAAVEPAASPLLEGGEAGPHMLQGIGANFIPEILDRKIYDEVIPVGNEEAMRTARELCRLEGILVGITSGAAVWAAAQLAKRPEFAGKYIVALLPDSGDRYLADLFGDGEQDG
ncbi:cysteine synthase [Cuneatibacter caecimuris]|uniref:cysteine synthase n=2 Tax=Cuneatibacter caecimuris TaxID=1796618 RepID=A0A4Q7PQ50_9FIRM|nr:cysteine synthase [Cuneatibacter caecimuris]